MFDPLKILQDYLRASRHERLANKYYQQKQFAEAIAEYQAAIAIRPGLRVARFNLGIALYKAGRKREARTEWEMVVKLARGNNPYLVEQAEIMLRQFN